MTEKNCSHLELKNLISLHEMSQECELSHGHLAHLIRKGELKGWKIGRNWVTTREALIEYRKKNLKPGPKKE